MALPRLRHDCPAAARQACLPACRPAGLPPCLPAWPCHLPLAGVEPLVLLLLLPLLLACGRCRVLTILQPEACAMTISAQLPSTQQGRRMSSWCRRGRPAPKCTACTTSWAGGACSAVHCAASVAASVAVRSGDEVAVSSSWHADLVCCATMPAGVPCCPLTCLVLPSCSLLLSAGL